MSQKLRRQGAFGEGEALSATWKERAGGVEESENLEQHCIVERRTRTTNVRFKCPNRHLFKGYKKQVKLVLMIY